MKKYLPFLLCYFRYSEVVVLFVNTMSSADEESSDNEAELRNYSVVQFIKRGRPSVTRQVDVVPSKWLESKSKGRLSTRFPELSSTPDDSKFVHDFVKSCADAPESWKLYTVVVLGQACTYLNQHFIAFILCLISVVIIHTFIILFVQVPMRKLLENLILLKQKNMLLPVQK